MVVPLVTTGLLAKRLNQVSRIAKAVTVPDILRERFGSPSVGLVATGLLTFFMFFYLLAQYLKAGSQILATLLQDMPLFQQGVLGRPDGRETFSNATDRRRLLALPPALCQHGDCLHDLRGIPSRIWTDVMQGIVMVIGVVIMLFLVLYQVGGLSQATQNWLNSNLPKAVLFESNGRNPSWRLEASQRGLAANRDGGTWSDWLSR